MKTGRILAAINARRTPSAMSPAYGPHFFSIKGHPRPERKGRRRAGQNNPRPSPGASGWCILGVVEGTHVGAFGLTSSNKGKAMQISQTKHDASRHTLGLKTRVEEITNRWECIPIEEMFQAKIEAMDGLGYDLANWKLRLIPRSADRYDGCYDYILAVFKRRTP
jgi:hypothetical protein